MTRFLLTLPLIPLFLAACTPAQQTTTLGALGGAAVGAAVSSDSDRDKGAIVGALVGGSLATLLGPAANPGQCRYRYSDGTVVIAPCQ